MLSDDLVASFGIEMELDYSLTQTPSGWSTDHDGSLRARPYQITTVKTPSGKRVHINPTPLEYKTNGPVISKHKFVETLLATEDWAASDVQDCCGLHVHVGFKSLDRINKQYVTLNLPRLVLSCPELAKAVVISGRRVDYEIRTNLDKERTVDYCNVKALDKGLCHRDSIEADISYLHSKNIVPNPSSSVAYSPVTLRSRYKTLEYRSPSPKCDRKQLAELILFEVNTLEPLVEYAYNKLKEKEREL